GMVQLLLLLFLFFYTVAGSSQDSLSFAVKSITAVRLEKSPVIDGLPDPDIWRKLPLATGFIQYSPYNGKKPLYDTEVRFGYDETGLYVAAFMHDPYPDSIHAELGKRDQGDDLNTDFITIDILPYNDGLTMFEFRITPAGLQGDTKYTATGRESSWDAVWESAVSINDSGWVAELMIPYSALRFPRTEVQTWGINIWRDLNRYKEMSTWSYIPNDQQDLFRYYGTLKGMEGIKPPLRLSLTPYLGGYLEKRPGTEKWDRFLRGGMDLKFGISQSFTLDMELIPDFGQVQSDDIILNLTPFEIRYDERRQFFTEGTEMFEKCDIFYSRRVGSVPKGYDEAGDNLGASEKLTKNPELTQVINATKISGRNRNGLGLGVFNGMTTNTWATAQDTITGSSRR
ncbi:MAG: carbohydrate binding family 9 domain-containing protein, partial [Bacteroidales bacterium]|nr:carbohydrate binding family 9 domain-containing protein [Bacteroidales bacterium]